MFTKDNVPENYLSYLDYKRQMKIVRYYPLKVHYESYRYFCKAHGLVGFGTESPDVDNAHAALCQALKFRLTENGKGVII